MVEKNVHSEVQKSSGSGCNLEKNIDTDLKENFVKDGTMVTTTFGEKESIPIWEAAYVFRPAVARGDLGLMLTEFLGIGKVRDLLLHIVRERFDKPTAFYTMGVPIEDSYCQKATGTLMVARHWIKLKEGGLRIE